MNDYTDPWAHTLAHALTPALAGCQHSMRDIISCVLCGKTLSPDRQHVDTCGERCFKELLKLQTMRERALNEP